MEKPFLFAVLTSVIFVLITIGSLLINYSNSLHPAVTCLYQSTNNGDCIVKFTVYGSLYYLQLNVNVMINNSLTSAITYDECDYNCLKCDCNYSINQQYYCWKDTNITMMNCVDPKIEKDTDRVLLAGTNSRTGEKLTFHVALPGATKLVEVLEAGQQVEVDL